MHLCAPVSEDTGGGLVSFPVISPPYLLRQGLSLILEFTEQKLARQQAPGPSCLNLPGLFYTVAGDSTQVFMLARHRLLTPQPASEHCSTAQEVSVLSPSNQQLVICLRQGLTIAQVRLELIM